MGYAVRKLSGRLQLLPLTGLNEIIHITMSNPRRILKNLRSKFSSLSFFMHHPYQKLHAFHIAKRKTSNLSSILSQSMFY